MTAPAEVLPAVAPKRRRPTREVEGVEVLRLMARGVLRRIACKRAGLGLSTLEHWVDEGGPFAADYFKAQVRQAHAFAEQMILISDRPVGADMAEVQRNRLRVDTRKWYVSKLAPKLYGDRIEHTHEHRHAVVMLPALSGPSGPATPERIGPERAGTSSIDGARAVLARSVEEMTPEVRALPDVTGTDESAGDSESDGIGGASA